MTLHLLMTKEGLFILSMCSMVLSVKRFSNAEIPAMTYSIPSDITRIDASDDGRIDRLYVGDMGGRMWRFDIVGPDPAG
jgi:Tfp pilus tip-associated adhesin PilY1